MPAASATTPTIAPEFVARLAERAQEAERLCRLPADTIDDLNASGFTELLVPARYGGSHADFLAILDPVRRMAPGGSIRDETVPGARSAGADGPGRADRRGR